MNAKKAKLIRKLRRQADALGPERTTTDPRDVGIFVCACGKPIPRPSYSVPKQAWITSRHLESVTDWITFKSKSGVTYVQPLGVLRQRRAYHPQAPIVHEPEPAIPVGIDPI